MFYCGGGNDRQNYLINLAVSADLFHWDRVKTLFTGGIGCLFDFFFVVYI
jgi:hypothetical protein